MLKASHLINNKYAHIDNYIDIEFVEKLHYTIDICSDTCDYIEFCAFSHSNIEILDKFYVYCNNVCIFENDINKLCYKSDNAQFIEIIKNIYSYKFLINRPDTKWKIKITTKNESNDKLRVYFIFGILDGAYKTNNNTENHLFYKSSFITNDFMQTLSNENTYYSNIDFNWKLNCIVFEKKISSLLRKRIIREVDRMEMILKN